MAKTESRVKKPSGSRITKYFQETRAEIEKVTWPTREQAVRLTLIVLAVTFGLALFLTLVDFIFNWLIGRVLAYDMIVLAVVAVAIIGGSVYWAIAGRKR